MTIPFNFGWPQIIVLLVLIIGLGLLITSLVELRRPRMEHYIDEQGKHVHMRRRHRRFRFRPGRSAGGVLLMILALSLLWLGTVSQTYLGLTNGIKVAQVRANTVKNQPNTMNVELILFDRDGKQISDDFYTVLGDEWYIKSSIIKFPEWLNILGVHSGYKLTRLGGSYNIPAMERTAKHSVIELNGGDDGFFQWANTQPEWVHSFVEATYGNAVFQKADGKSYDVLVSQTGLFARPTNP